MRKQNFCFYLAVILFGQFLFPLFAYANMVTSVVPIWASLRNLLILNMAIGIFEGLFIAKVFKASILRSIWIMIAANYVSTVFGLIGLGVLGGLLSNGPIFQNEFLFIGMIFVISYVITVIIEWPFCFRILAGQENRRIRSFKASIFVQTISYLILIGIGLYWGQLTFK